MKLTKEFLFNMEKLDRLLLRKERIESVLNKEDDLKKSFYGGMVGFKKGSAKKKWENKISKELDLLKELEIIKSKIDKIQNPLKYKKSVELNPNVFKIGDFAFETFNNKVEIIKINTKTVTVKYQSGFKETVKPHLLTKIICKDNQ